MECLVLFFAFTRLCVACFLAVLLRCEEVFLVACEEAFLVACDEVFLVACEEVFLVTCLLETALTGVTLRLPGTLAVWERANPMAGTRASAPAAAHFTRRLII